MQVISASTYPTSNTDPLPCPLCHGENNALAVAESGIEKRFNMPVLPTRDYYQAECTNCGLLYINVPVKQAYLDTLYSQESVDWATEYLGSADVAMNSDERQRFSTIVDIVAKVRNLKGVRWLDFGCQTGELGDDAIKKHGVVMSGVEISEDYAERAARLWGRDRNVVKSSLDGHNGAQFDVISSLETLEHLAEPWETLQTMKQYLADDGVLVVSVPSSDYFMLKYRIFKILRTIFSAEKVKARPDSSGSSIYGLCHTHLYNFTPKSLSLLLERGGFRVERVCGIGWLSRYWVFSKIARIIELATGGHIAIFPSVLAVARKA
jgi:2-polyprenyl-3-methyl-5-hydroxy-6-metoxy-1,4-benzoquinol methylase